MATVGDHGAVAGERQRPYGCCLRQDSNTADVDRLRREVQSEFAERIVAYCRGDSASGAQTARGWATVAVPPGQNAMESAHTSVPGREGRSAGEGDVDEERSDAEDVELADGDSLFNGSIVGPSHTTTAQSRHCKSCKIWQSQSFPIGLPHVA